MRRRIAKIESQLVFQRGPDPDKPAMSRRDWADFMESLNLVYGTGERHGPDPGPVPTLAEWTAQQAAALKRVYGSEPPPIEPTPPAPAPQL